MRMFPDGINYCQRIATDSSTLISCTRVSRSLNSSNSERKAPDAGDALYGNISAALLHTSIVSGDSQARLDSLSLLCDNPKTTEPVLSIELALVKKFLHHNSESSSPAFRQSVVTAMKRLLSRLRESWIFGNKATNRVMVFSTQKKQMLTQKI